jgi:hypothetical protein
MSANQTRPTTAERRGDPRYPARVEVTVEDAQHGKLSFTASGMSRTGAFLRRRDSGTPLPLIGNVVKLSFNWPIETHIPPLKVEAKVVRQTNDGIGVLFEIM